MSNGYLKLDAKGQLYGKVVTRNIDLDIWCKLTTSKNPAAPAFEILTKSKSGTPFKIGVGFEKRTKEVTDNATGVVTGGLPFYSMSIDDPALSAPLYVTAFCAKEPDRKEEFDIVWQRPRAKEQAAA